ncbi:MAG: NADP-dependent oxidoreductase [Myxococcales bacterium]|nr:NADP-dependent oxidoreductase [Myxococcales bacterium]
MIPERMRAVRMHAYGGPEVLQVDDVPTPTAGKGQVLVEIHASSVNPVDWKIRSGGQRGLVRYRLPRTLGLDVSGVVVAVGPGVTRFQVGDAVYGSPNHTEDGCYAEYAALPEAQLAAKPAQLTHLEAAALPLVGLTAWEALVRKADLQPGERALIHAGAGGVGHVAIQIAKARGAEVITTCSAANAELVRSLGADRVVDYRAERFYEVLSDLDVVLEGVGGPVRDQSLAVLRRGGRMPSIVGGFPAYTKRLGPVLGPPAALVDIAAFMVKARLTKGVKVYQVMRPPRGDLLEALSALVEAGALRPRIDRVFPLEDVAEAHRYSETGRARGKIVIAVRASDQPQ